MANEVTLDGDYHIERQRREGGIVLINDRRDLAARENIHLRQLLTEAEIIVRTQGAEIAQLRYQYQTQTRLLLATALLCVVMFFAVKPAEGAALVSDGAIAAPPAVAFVPEHHVESYYQKQWCSANLGVSKGTTLSDNTVVDCLGPAEAVEVDFAGKWYECVGQALHYARLTGKVPGCLLIIEEPDQCRFLLRLRELDRWLTELYQIRGRPFILIWTTGGAAGLC